MLSHLSLRLRIFLFFCLMGLGTVAIFAGSLAFVAARAAPGSTATQGFVTAAILGGFLSLALILGVWRLFDEHVGRAIQRLSADLRAHAHSEVDAAVRAEGARYLGDLAPAAQAVATSLKTQKSALEQSVAERTALIKAEADHVTALLSDVQAGLLLCSADHTVVFYNAHAVELLNGAGRPRLDRSIFDLLRAGPIRATFSRLVSSDGAERDAELLVSTTSGGRAIAAHMRLVSGALGLGDRPGYVLTLRDMTADLRLHSDRARMLRDMVDALRPPAAGLRALLDLRADAPTEASADVGTALLAEAETLVSVVQDVTERYDAAQDTLWPMQAVRASHLIDGLRGQLGDYGPVVEAPAPHMMLRCDGFALIGLLSALVEHVHDAGLARTFSLAVTPDGHGAMLALSWDGPPLDDAELQKALETPVTDHALGLSGREILDQHGTEIWPTRHPDGRAALMLPISEAWPVPPSRVLKGHLAERPAVFDFALLNRSRDAAKSGRRLNDLTFVVFDTETTGLDPHGGDEIVQIAAVRVMNGRIVEGEALDRLVDPGRPIPPVATKVHGISDAMVQGAPGIAEAGAQFHRFCENAVLVAHNAPFDMAFFHRHAAAIGATFEHPVFDTVLLSAILFGQKETHTLDALADRFGVVIPQEDRHTAYGDTLATAKVLLRMLPMLEARKLDTFDAVMDEMQKNSRLLREMKARVGSA